jgi:hypothetical protein
MGPPSYMRSVVDRSVVMWRMTVYLHGVEEENFAFFLPHGVTSLPLAEE